MRKFILHVLIVVIMLCVMIDCGYDIDTWQHWVINIGCCCIYLNAAIPEKAKEE